MVLGRVLLVWSGASPGLPHFHSCWPLLPRSWHAGCSSPAAPQSRSRASQGAGGIPREPVVGGLAPGQLVGGDTSLFVLEAERCGGALRAGTEVWGAQGMLNAPGCQALAWPRCAGAGSCRRCHGACLVAPLRPPAPVLGELLGSEQLCKPIKSSASLTPRGSCSGDLHWSNLNRSSCCGGGAWCQQPRHEAGGQGLQLTSPGRQWGRGAWARPQAAPPWFSQCVFRCGS